MEEKLRQEALDVITPYLAQGVPFVTVQQIIDAMNRRDSGMTITRGLLMKILDPNTVKAVDKIEGDRIVLAKPEGEEDEAEESEDQQKQEQQADQHVNDMAQDAAKNAVKQPQQ